MNLEEKTISQNLKFDGRIIKVSYDEVLLPNGKTASREVVRHSGGVCVAAIDENNELVFVKQFRYPFDEVLLELPAGKIDPNEAPEICGKRELMEETGITAEKFTSLGLMYPTVAFCDEIIYAYFAENLSYGDTHLDEDEFVEIVKIPFDKALEMVMSGEIKDGKTQLAILKLAVLRNENSVK